MANNNALQTLNALTAEISAYAVRFASNGAMFTALVEDIIAHAAKVACLFDGVRLSTVNISERRSELWLFAEGEMVRARVA